MRLIHTEKVKMYRIAKAMLRDETNIEDAIQTTILKAYENIKKKKRRVFQTWLIRILMNECNNIIRTYKKIIVTEENDYNMSACDQYEDIDLCNAIQSLHEELRAVTVLYYYEDMNQESIAKLLEVPKGTVKSRLARARNNYRND